MATFISDLIELLNHPYIACSVLVAFVFDFLNGFHDAANSIATIVGTRTLPPFYAVLWAAWWNFVAAWVFGIHVANTVASWVHADYVTADVILAGLLAPRSSLPGTGRVCSKLARWSRPSSSS